MYLTVYIMRRRDKGRQKGVNLYAIKPLDKSMFSYKYWIQNHCQWRSFSLTRIKHNSNVIFLISRLTFLPCVTFLSLISFVSFHVFYYSGFNMLATQSFISLASKRLLWVISFSVSEPVLSLPVLFTAESFMRPLLHCECKRVRTASVSAENCGLVFSQFQAANCSASFSWLKSTNPVAETLFN